MKQVNHLSVVRNPIVHEMTFTGLDSANGSQDRVTSAPRREDFVHTTS